MAVEGTQAGVAFVEILPDFSKFNDAMSKFGRKVTTAGRHLSLGLTLPVVAAAAASAKLAADYDTAFRHIQGLTGESQKSIDGYRESLLQLSPKVNTGPVELANALYFIASAGVHGKTAIDILGVSAKAARAGLGETTVVADALTSAINAYGASNLSAAKAGDQLVTAVKLGKGEAAAFAPVLGNLLPTAQKLHISFGDVAGALASVTDLGTNAPEAATQISAFMSSILKVTPKASKALKAHGLTQQNLLDDLKKGGLPKLLGVINKAFGGNIIQVAKFLPNVRALRGYLSLTGQNAKNTAAIFREINGKKGKGALDRAFNDTQQGDAAKFHALLVHLQVDGIRLGQVLLPPLEKLVAKIGDLLTWVERLNPHTRRMIGTFILVGAALGPVLLALGLLAKTIVLVSQAVEFLGLAIKFALGPWGLIILAIIAVGIYLVYLYRHSATFHRIVVRAFKAVQQAAHWLWFELQHKVWPAAKSVWAFLVRQWPKVITVFRAVVTAARWIGREFMAHVWPALISVYNWVRSHWRLVTLLLTGPIGLAVVAIVRNFRTIVRWISNNIIPKIKDVGDWGKTAFGWIEDSSGTLSTALEFLYDNSLKPIVDAFKWVLDHAGSVVSLFGKVADIAESALSHIPGLGRASGGVVNSGTTYMVGERGPELFRPRSNGTIVPNHSLSGLAASGGGGGRQALTITNWRDGTGYFQDVSRGTISQAAALRTQQRRQHR